MLKRVWEKGRKNGRVLGLLAVILVAGFACALAPAPPATPPAKPLKFHNPIKKDSADPCLVFYDHWYYLTTTTGKDIRMRRARRLVELYGAPDEIIWNDGTPSRSKDIWAPEFHLLDSGKGLHWFLYFSASDGTEARHRMYVAESDDLDPLGPYHFKSELHTDPLDEYFAIHGTVLDLGQVPGSGGAAHTGPLYFLWSGRPSNTEQGLYISKMSDPWTLTGSRQALPADGFGCPFYREAPETLQHAGPSGKRIFLIYSACDAATSDSKLGMLNADAAADLMDPTAWKQDPTPVLSRNDAKGVYGPGQCFFFKSPDGQEDWMAYDAKSTTSRTLTDRSTRAQRFNWNADGTPDFGSPVGLDTELSPPSGEPPPAPPLFR